MSRPRADALVVAAPPPDAGGSRSPSALRPAAVTLAVLLAVLVAGLAWVVPWTPLPGADSVPDVAADFSPEQVAREVAYHDAVRPPAYGSLGLNLLVAAGLALTPLGGRVVRAVARPLGGGWVWQVLLGTLALTALGRLVTLPLAARAEVVRRDVGLSTHTWGSWLVDVAKAVGVSSALAGVVLLVLVGLARRAPRTWWAWGAGAAAALVVAGSFGYPLVVEPVFLRFTPLPAGELRQDLLELAEREGVAIEDVVVADASRRTTALNAYVSGFAGSRRIVLYDTLVESAPREEVLLVVAHELGHARHSDVLKGTLLGAVGAAAAVCALFLLLRGTPLLQWARAGGPGDPRVVPMLLLLAAVGSLLVGPVTNLASRRVEARADVTALDLTGDVATFAATQRRLALRNLSDLDPNPVAYWLFASHPSTTERLALAREWQRLRGEGAP